MTLLDDLLPALRSRLEALYGERLAHAALLGSCARGVAAPESGVAVLGVLHQKRSSRGEVRGLSDASASGS